MFHLSKFNEDQILFVFALQQFNVNNLGLEENRHFINHHTSISHGNIIEQTPNTVTKYA